MYEMKEPPMARAVSTGHSWPVAQSSVAAIPMPIASSTVNCATTSSSEMRPDGMGLQGTKVAYSS